MQRAACELAAAWEAISTFRNAQRTPLLIKAVGHGPGSAFPRASEEVHAAATDSGFKHGNTSSGSGGDGACVWQCEPQANYVWVQKEWLAHTFVIVDWENPHIGSYTLEQFLMASYFLDVSADAFDKPKGAPTPFDKFCAAGAVGVDEYVFVARVAPVLAVQMGSGSGAYMAPVVVEKDAWWQQEEFVKEACNVILLWRGRRRVSGASVAAATRKQQRGAFAQRCLAAEDRVA